MDGDNNVFPLQYAKIAFLFNYLREFLRVFFLIFVFALCPATILYAQMARVCLFACRIQMFWNNLRCFYFAQKLII